MDAGLAHAGLGAPFRLSSVRPIATEIDRAIDPSCRACGAGAWALGLAGFRPGTWGSPFRSVFTYPQLTSDLPSCASL